MKKALVVLLALTCLSALAFADDVAWTFGVTVKTGAAITLGDSTSYPDAVIIANDADDPALSRVRFDADAALGDFSAHARLNSDTAGAAPSFANWWVNAYWLDKMIQMQFGILDHKVTDTVNKGWGGLNVTGGQFVVTPISGLSIGLALPVPAAQDTIAHAWAGLSVGAAYTMPNLVTVKATYMNAAGDKLSDIAAGIALLAVPNLVAQFEVQDTDLGSSATVLSSTFGFKSGGIELFENATYAMGPLTPGLELYQVLPADSSLKTSMYFKPNVDYMVMTGLNVGASVKYTIQPYLGAIADDSALAIDPYVKFTFNSKAVLKVDAAYTIPDMSKTSTWALPINFNFMFSY